MLTASRLARVAPVILAFVVGASASERIACAQNAGAAAEAQTLFDEGRQLMNKGDFAHACPKFAASQQADPAAGTLLNLANCYEKNGQTASAWVTFKDAAGAARAANHRDWEKRANEHASTLEKGLSRLTVRVANGDASLQIKRDDAPVGAALLGTAIPVDPGMHTVDATAPGKKPFHVSVEVASGGERKEVIIPALEDGPAGPVAPTANGDAGPASATPPAAGTDGSGQRTVGIVLGSVGAASIIVGAVTGIMAIGKNSSAKDICPNAGACSSETAVDDSNSSHSLGTVSTVTFVAGGAFLAGGLLTFLLAPKSASSSSAGPSWTAAPLLGNGQTGLGVSGHF